MPKHISWNLTDLFNSDTDPAIAKEKKRIQKATNAFVAKWKERKDYLTNIKALKEALDEYEAWAREFGGGGKLTSYFFLRFQQEQSNPDVKALYLKSEEFYKEEANKMRFFELNLAKIPEKQQQKFLSSKDLTAYHHMLERMFAEAKYLLTEKEEMIMTMKSSTAYGQWVDMLEGLLVKEERTVLQEDGSKKLTDFSSLMNLMNSHKKKVRDAAAVAFNDILVKYADVAEAELNAVITDKKVNDQIRNVSRPDLTRHIADDMDTKVVEAMLSAVEKRNDIAQRFYKVKAKLLKQEKLAYHERNVEIGNLDGTKYSWTDAVTLVERVFDAIDPKFGDVFRMFVQEGRFDVFPKKGKGSGAFCFHHLIAHPTYILLNHTGTIRDVLTIAHEVGHGINNELIREKQHGLYFGTPTSTAEVASTFFEDFVTQELAKTADTDTTLALKMMKLNEEISTIFRQVACYRFEQALHAAVREKGYVSHVEIGRLFQTHMAAYMGTAVEQSEGAQNWWIYWSHIRRYFYVYSYASGLLISKSFQHMVRKDPEAVEKVKDFLSVGLSESPAHTFERLGISIDKKSFWNEGLDEMDKELKEVETLVTKMK